jgi:hypothetical protein
MRVAAMTLLSSAGVIEIYCPCLVFVNYCETHET